MRKPIAVLISDVHYNLQTLEVADAAMRQAIDKANQLDVPFIVAGDLHDTKANVRAECISAIADTLDRCNNTVYLIRGNHDAVNEKSDDSVLDVLHHEERGGDGELLSKIEVVRHPYFYNELGTINGRSIHLIPYQHDPEKLRAYLKKVDKYSCIIMHQGLKESAQTNIIDPTAITKQDVAEFRVISGHYHRRETISCRSKIATTPSDFGGVIRYAVLYKLIGQFDYIGNPYTLSFGEANDPEKGFQILYNDGSLEFVPTYLRRHIILELDDQLNAPRGNTIPNSNDLVWVKIRGSYAKLAEIKRSAVKDLLKLENFKLDLIPDAVVFEETPQKTKDELFDAIIDQLDATPERKSGLKELWRKILS